MPSCKDRHDSRRWHLRHGRHPKGECMRRRASLTLGTLVLVAAMAATLVPGATASSRPVASKAAPFDGRAWLRTHGYLPLRGVATLRRAKAHAAAEAAAMGYQPST